HVEWQAHQLDAEIERDQIGGRNQHQHAEGREQHQHAVFEFLLFFSVEIVERQHLEVACVIVDHEATTEQHETSGRHPCDHGVGHQHQHTYAPAIGGGRT